MSDTWRDTWRNTWSDGWGAIVGQTATVHDWEIGAAEYRRHEARRGRRHAYGPRPASQTALVVIDMVPHFVTDGSVVASIVTTVNTTAERLRCHGGVIAWVVPTVGEPTGWQRGFFGEQIASLYAASGGEGAPADRLVAGLDVERADIMVEKSAPSAFFPGRCDLHDLLRGRGVERVWIAGAVTSVCCESSARDAATLGYETIVLADATADVSDAAHNAALRTLYRSFADVRSADDAVALAHS